VERGKEEKIRQSKRLKKKHEHPSRGKVFSGEEEGEKSIL